MSHARVRLDQTRANLAILSQTCRISRSFLNQAFSPIFVSARAVSTLGGDNLAVRRQQEWLRSNLVAVRLDETEHGKVGQGSGECRFI